MQLTIVKEDNLVLVDRKAQTFDLSGYSLPEDLWALQWQDNNGEIEYTNKNNEKIDVLPDWTKPIIEEHQRFVKEQTLQKEKENQQAIFLENGQVRIQRIQRKNEEQQDKDQKSVNSYIRRMINVPL